MPQWHGNLNKRKKTGGRKKSFRGKRAFEMGSDPTETTLGPKRLAIQRSRGGNIKQRLLSGAEANVTDAASGRTQRTEITGVVRNPANVDYQRRGVITKGSIIDTPLGQARVTSSPGQDGVVNAILIEKAERQPA